MRHETNVNFRCGIFVLFIIFLSIFISGCVKVPEEDIKIETAGNAFVAAPSPLNRNRFIANGETLPFYPAKDAKTTLAELKMPKLWLESRDENADAVIIDLPANVQPLFEQYWKALAAYHTAKQFDSNEIFQSKYQLTLAGVQLQNELRESHVIFLGTATPLSEDEVISILVFQTEQFRRQRQEIAAIFPESFK